MTQQQFVAGAANQRLDVCLAAQSALTRSRVQSLIAEGNVAVNGLVMLKASLRLNPGDVIAVDLPEPSPLAVLAEDIPLDIIYEDADMVVVNKARGMVVHPGAGVERGTLVNALLAHCRDLSGVGGVLRPGIVHRLDKDTTGVMVVAKNDAAHLNLARQIAAKTATRTYLALVGGVIAEPSGRIVGRIGRSKLDRQKMAVLSDGGKEAITTFTVRERFAATTFLACQLLTGRTHQIRVHLAYISHPVLGDRRYANRALAEGFGIAGQALHSWQLSLAHPRTDQPLTFRAPLPYDFAALLEQLRHHANQTRP